MQLRTRWSSPTLVTAAGIAVATLVFATLAWERRWMSDDGLIIVRTVRQLLAGNGPVLNICERVETDTSTLWTYLLTALVAVTRGDPAYVAVFAGGLLSIGGVAIALDATRRFHRARGATGVLAPAGVVVLLGASPFWDYATSGLETGLATCWAATIWWSLVTLSRDAGHRRRFACAIVVGLGPLVRPELAVATVAFAVAMWAIVRPPRRETLRLAAAALALPLGYELFRAGYYGVLVPMPALAKSAGNAEWSRGFDYVIDLVAPYWLWLPLAALAALAAIAIVRRRVTRADAVVVAAPLATALAIAVYVVRVGGDFMHGRMLLPPVLFALLPAFVVPVRAASAPVIAVVVGWALWSGTRRAEAERHQRRNPLVGDERFGYINWTGSPHPIDAQLFVNAAAPSSTAVIAAVGDDVRRFVTEDGRVTVPLDPARCGSVAYGYGRLGTAGATVPLDGIVVDTLGLGNPIGARITVTSRGRPGHEKTLPLVWQLADYAPADVEVRGIFPNELRAARRVLACDEPAELLASVRAPLTIGRFWDNLVGAVARTRLVIPVDPLEAEWKFCDIGLDARRVIVSSSYEGEGISRDALIDGVLEQRAGAPGFSSHTGIFTDHAEWIELRYALPRPIGKVVLYPVAHGDGYPVDFAIQVWDGERWVDRVTRTGSPAYDTPQTYAWSPPDVTDRVRLVATHLRTVLGGYVIELAELEAR